MPTIRRGRNPRPRKTVIYGPGGVGKSTFALSAPACVGLPIEDGLNDIDCASFPRCLEYADFVGACRDLYSGGPAVAEFRNVAVDSADWLYTLCVKEAGRINKFESPEDLDYGKGWQFADEVFLKALDVLDRLNREKGLGIIVISHAKVTRFADPARESYDRWEPKLRSDPRKTETPGEKIFEWADEVFFASWRTYTETKEIGFGREEVKATGTGERLIFTTERPAHRAKNRLAMPDEIPLAWSEYAKYFPTASAVSPATATAANVVAPPVTAA